jgi:hypothetical protein
MYIIALATVALAVVFSSCATKKEAWGSLKKGMNMRYSSGLEKELAYKSTTNFIQEMNVMNQEISVTADMMQMFKMEPMETDNEDLGYKVTVDDMAFKLQTPRGDIEPELGNIIGKSFELIVSPYGEELDYSGAEKLVMEVATGDSKSIASDIAAFFPNLPDHPVKPGDSWKSIDNVRDANESKETILVFDNINTFEKLENYMGYDCMKVNVVFTGTLAGEGTQEGMELITTGEISGTGTWYYAYKEGIFVSSSVEGNGKTETLVAGEGQEISIPATRTFTMMTQLASK